MISLVPLIAAFSPFLVWPIELVLPYPYIVEEVLKAILILFLLDIKSKSSQVKTVFAAGVLFALSETVLYIFNLSLKGDIYTLLTRLLLTIPLHVGTFLIILLPTFKKKWLVVFGLWVAVMVHYFFNLIVAS